MFIKNLFRPKKAKETVKATQTVTFEHFAPEAKQVLIAGSFNSWNSKDRVLEKSADGRWRTAIELTPGSYEYRYVVDGAWQDDKQSAKKVKNPYGTFNSVVEVRTKNFTPGC